MRAKALPALAAALVLLAAATAQGEMKEISFRRKKDNFLQLYCQKIAGKMRTSITCNGKPFTPDAEWEEINAEQVCFQNEDGRIRACDELSKLGSAKKSYACFDVSGKQSPFKPGKEWKRLAGKETICTEEWNRSDVPRNMTMPSLNFE